MPSEDFFEGGKHYIASKLAARVSKYSSDYIGELCRSQKLKGRLIGRVWYVSEESLRDYIKKPMHPAHKEEKKSEKSIPAPVSVSVPVQSETEESKVPEREIIQEDLREIPNYPNYPKNLPPREEYYSRVDYHEPDFTKIRELPVYRNPSRERMGSARQMQNIEGILDQKESVQREPTRHRHLSLAAASVFTFALIALLTSLLFNDGVGKIASLITHPASFLASVAPNVQFKEDTYALSNKNIAPLDVSKTFPLGTVRDSGTGAYFCFGIHDGVMSASAGACLSAE